MIFNFIYSANKHVGEMFIDLLEIICYANAGRFSGNEKEEEYNDNNRGR